MKKNIANFTVTVNPNDETTIKVVEIVRDAFKLNIHTIYQNGMSFSMWTANGRVMQSTEVGESLFKKVFHWLSGFGYKPRNFVLYNLEVFGTEARVRKTCVSRVAFTANILWSLYTRSGRWFWNRKDALREAHRKVAAFKPSDRTESKMKAASLRALENAMEKEFSKHL